MFSLISLLILILSFVCSVISLIVPNVFLTVAGGIFLSYIAVVIHELGHAVGCKIKGNRIVSVSVFPFEVKNGKLFLTEKLKYAVFFETGINDKPIYFLGILFSSVVLLVTIPFLILFTSPLTIVLTVATGLPLIGAIGTGKNGDLYKSIYNDNKKIGE